MLDGLKSSPTSLLRLPLHVKSCRGQINVRTTPRVLPLDCTLSYDLPDLTQLSVVQRERRPEVLSRRFHARFILLAHKTLVDCPAAPSVCYVAHACYESEV